MSTQTAKTWLLIFMGMLTASSPLLATSQEDCGDTTVSSAELTDPRIRLAETATLDPKTRQQLLAQQTQVALFLKFLDENQGAESLPAAPEIVEIRAGEKRTPWRAVADFVAGSPYRLQQYPDTKTLIVRIPWYPVLNFRPISAGTLVDVFYRGRHLDRVDRIALRVRRRMRDFAGLKERKVATIRSEIQAAASEASEKLSGLLERSQREGLGAAAVRLQIGGLVQAEATLSGAEHAHIEGWETDVLLKLLETAKEHLDSGRTTEELVHAAQESVSNFSSVSRNVWDWRVSVAPFIIRSQDIGQIHTWGDSPSRASSFVAGPQNKSWFFHFNLGWLIVDTLDDYDIRVYNQVSIHKGAEMVLALSRAISDLSGS